MLATGFWNLDKENIFYSLLVARYFISGTFTRRIRCPVSSRNRVTASRDITKVLVFTKG
jgi:hypothetical protein